MKPRASTKKRGKNPEQKKVWEKWDKYYRETLPKKILEATEAFDDSVIKYMESPLMNEIEANLQECKTDAQRERYLFSLLIPFGETGCNIARIYTPTAEINRLNEAIRKCEEDKAHWQTMSEDGEIDACKRMIKDYREQIDWVWEVNKQFIELTCMVEDGAKWMQKGTVESCLSAFVGVIVMFANRLDALLLTYGIDLLRLQRESGLYLKDHRLITDVDFYIGSTELAQRYIDALPKVPQPEQASNGQTANAQSLNPEPQRGKPEQTKNVVLPEVLNLERVRQVFDGAIKKGWMHTNGKGGYEWVGFGKRGQGQQLVYMCGQIFGYVKGRSGNVGASIPSKEIGDLFDISGFYNKLIKCWEAKPQIWREPIDEMIEEVTKSTPK